MKQYITIISNIFHIYAVYQFSQLLFQKDPSRKRTEILAYIGYFLLNSGCFILFHNIVINVLSNILLFFCITLLYPTTWAHRILATVSIYIISMAADILCTTISIWCEYTLFFTSGFAASLLMLIIARMSLHFHLYKSDVIPRLNIFYVFTAIFIPLGSILLAHYIARTLSWRSLVAAIVLLLINVSVFSLYDRMIHLIQEHHTALLIEKQNKAYQQQLQFMQKSQMRLRFLRHDMKNHLFQIKHFLETNDMEGMYTYINDLEDNLDLTQSITYTQHEAINIILNYKLLPLRTDGVALEVDVQLPDQLTYPIFDLNVLLGNLLDNAIEATALVTPKENQKITLKMKERFGALQLQVGNRFNSNIVPKNGTHKSDKINHGLGLKSVQEIVRRHHGKMWIVPEKDWFEINIILYDSNPEKLQGSGKSI